MSAFLRASGTFMRADSQTDRAKFARHRGLKSSFADVAWRASSQKKPSANPDRVLMPTCASGELQEISGRAVVSAAASNFRAAVAKAESGATVTKRGLLPAFGNCTSLFRRCGWFGPI